MKVSMSTGSVSSPLLDVLLESRSCAVIVLSELGILYCKFKYSMGISIMFDG